MPVTITEYRALLDDRPRKFSPGDVQYRDSDSLQMRCQRCIHFFERHRDRFAVCEIMRSDETDADGVDPDYVCDLYTEDGEYFPLRKAR